MYYLKIQMEQELQLISGIEGDDPERWVEVLNAE